MDDTEINFPSEEESYENYSIPQDILNLIDLEFLVLFKKNLCKVFNYTDIGSYGMSCQGGTGGWGIALKDTCFELKKLKIKDYYDNLEWFNSDYFDSLIVDLFIDHSLIEEDTNNINSIMDSFGLTFDFMDMEDTDDLT